MQLLLLLALAQSVVDSLPPPRGFVNDFAGVIDTAAAARMEARLRQVQQLTHGDIAVVTLSDLGGREASDVALEIGRRWRLGGAGGAGDPAKNLGVVVLLVPRKNHRPGSGDLYISTGRGAEGFLPDARVGRIRDAMTPSLANEDYGGGLEIGAGLLAQAFADEFHVTLSGPAPPVSAAPESRSSGPIPHILIVLILLILLQVAARVGRMVRRGKGRPWWTGGGWGGWGGGGFGGGFGGGGRGGFGGGFGGFGGGGGFSGGGAGGHF